MRQLFAELKAAGYEVVFQYGDITVTSANGSIAIGQEDGLFSAYVQQNLPEGPVYTSTEGLSQADVLQLVRSNASTASVAA